MHLCQFITLFYIPKLYAPGQYPTIFNITAYLWAFRDGIFCMRILFAIGLLLLHIASSTSSYAQESKVTVGSGYSLPPYMIDGSQRGLLSEIVVASFVATGQQVEFKFDTNINSIKAFKSYQSDAVLNATSEAFPSSYLSDVVITFKNRAISLRKNNFQIQHINDLLKFSVIGFNAASKLLSSDYRQMVAQHTRYSERVRQIEQVQALLVGNTEVIIADELIFKYFRSQLARNHYSEQAYREQVDFHPVLPETHYRIAFHDEALRNKFNTGLKIINDNGLLAKIHRRYDLLLDSHLF